MPSGFDSSKTTGMLMDLTDMEKISKQLKNDANVTMNETSAAGNKAPSKDNISPITGEKVP